jgi:hypothetical protein
MSPAPNLLTLINPNGDIAAFIAAKLNHPPPIPYNSLLHTPGCSHQKFPSTQTLNTTSTLFHPATFHNPPTLHPPFFKYSYPFLPAIHPSSPMFLNPYQPGSSHILRRYSAINYAKARVLHLIQPHHSTFIIHHSTFIILSLLLLTQALVHRFHKITHQVTDQLPGRRVFSPVAQLRGAFTDMQVSRLGIYGSKVQVLPCMQRCNATGCGCAA